MGVGAVFAKAEEALVRTRALTKAIKLLFIKHSFFIITFNTKIKFNTLITVHTS